jgi:hypothetical protein
MLNGVIAAWALAIDGCRVHSLLPLMHAKSSRRPTRVARESHFFDATFAKQNWNDFSVCCVSRVPIFLQVPDSFLPDAA